jgi:hypothetical protein
VIGLHRFPPTSLQLSMLFSNPFVQYTIETLNSSSSSTTVESKVATVHIKTVFVGQIGSESKKNQQELMTDTEGTSFHSLADISSKGLSSLFGEDRLVSPLLKDSVFDFCLPLSLVALGCNAETSK